MPTPTLKIRDPIHAFVELPGETAALVNSMPLQRLRNIKQLALANLVYPGALHTRFDHTLGVAHVAREMAISLDLEGDERRLLLWAALLHDIGHGPFSHVSEICLQRFADPTTLKPGQPKDKIHELLTAEIIRTDPEIGKVVGEAERDAVIRLLDTGFGPPILKQLISGPLDADKQDYLLRDSYFCGVQYGVFDVRQLWRSLVVHGSGDDRYLMIDPDGIHAFEQFVLAKYYMTANVYRHRVRLIADQMIARGIRLGIVADQIPELERLYRFDNSEAFVRNYQQWDDSRFWEAFCPHHKAPPGPKSGATFRRLRERRLLKRVFSAKIETFDPRIREAVKGLSDAMADRIEERVAELLSRNLSVKFDRVVAVSAFETIVHSFTLKSVRETSRNDDASILVTDPLRPIEFEVASTLFKSINQTYADRLVEVYAPIDWPDPAQKDDLRRDWAGSIMTIIDETCRPEKRG